ncbi:MAG TPA: hypothetical protein VJ836_05090 [Candidatus Saccharimonadales bacterium]|nr:hypothetical protein [Candidatus Saccharimonadales bacterium]
MYERLWEAYELPNPSLTAARYAAVSGEYEGRLDAYSSALERLNCYAMAGVSAEEAAVLSAWRYPRETIRASFHLGYYDPARTQWILAPEYVDPQHHQPLNALLKEILPGVREELLKFGAAGEQIFDLYDVFTEQVRQEMAERLKPLRVRELLEYDSIRQLMEENGVLGADDATFCYPSLRPSMRTSEELSDIEIDDSLEGEDILPAQLLLLCYQGVKTVHPSNPGYSARGKAAIRLAKRSMADPDVWIPNIDLVTFKEWDIVQGIIQSLEAHAVSHPDFSLWHCAVAYNSRW